jgi:hypothetical protein
MYIFVALVRVLDCPMYTSALVFLKRQTPKNKKNKKRKSTLEIFKLVSPSLSPGHDLPLLHLVCETLPSPLALALCLS